jgi:hypothetical protein
LTQFELDNESKYYNNIKFFKLENNDNYSNKEEEQNDSSKPKENIPINESNSSKEDTIQEINIGYPVDTAEFKKLKDKSKRKMDTDDDDDNVTEDENVSKEDEN